MNPPVVIREDHADNAPQLNLIRALIDPLPQSIAVLNRSGRIVAINRAWRAFAINNGARDLKQIGPGRNYLDECERAAQKGSTDAEHVLIGLRQVLQAESMSFFFEYACDAPTIQRWYTLCASPIVAGGYEGALVTHSLSTAEHRARGRLKSDPASEDHEECLTMCSSCKRLRAADSLWQEIEDYLFQKYGERYSHGLCAECAEALYPLVTT